MKLTATVRHNHILVYSDSDTGSDTDTNLDPILSIAPLGPRYGRFVGRGRLVFVSLRHADVPGVAAVSWVHGSFRVLFGKGSNLIKERVVGGERETRGKRQGGRRKEERKEGEEYC